MQLGLLYLLDTIAKTLCPILTATLVTSSTGTLVKAAGLCVLSVMVSVETARFAAIARSASISVHVIAHLECTWTRV